MSKHVLHWPKLFSGFIHTAASNGYGDGEEAGDALGDGYGDGEHGYATGGGSGKGIGYGRGDTYARAAHHADGGGTGVGT